MTEILLTRMQRMKSVNVLHSSSLQNIDNTFCIVWIRFDSALAASGHFANSRSGLTEQQA